MPNPKEIVDEKKIYRTLETTQNQPSRTIDRILGKSLEKKGLTLEEASILLNVNDPAIVSTMFDIAGKIKKEIYGDRLVLFAPLYVSSFCINNCSYCGFQSDNPEERKKLSLDEVKQEVEMLIDMGHKRLLVEFGEHPKENPIDYVTEAIETIYQTKKGRGEIRRVNVNIAATSVENYKKLKSAGIGTYQLFQETYHRETYEKLHRNGPKSDFERQLFAHDRAFEAGIDDVGLGVLFGLYDYRFDVMALLSHAQYLDKKFGVGPHTFSVPRWQPAKTGDWKPEHPVSEDELLKIIAVLRMTVPYTGMIISTRERKEIREKAFEIGISQTSAASRTSPGGYTNESELEQFTLADHRPLDKVVESSLDRGAMPSFCTACYRRERTGQKFMDLAKPGDIQMYCVPNSILTLSEYLIDYAPPTTRAKGERVLREHLARIENPNIMEEVKRRLIRIGQGERDLCF
ncbi:MAG: [FeFe] hydrogenase H-cluster radical SAM maturase HydG [Nanoarchaeota archaeon]